VYRIAESARRHELVDDDILHAVRNAVAAEDLDDGFTMFIGPARNATLLEVGVVDGEDGPVIVHAMAARARYLRGRGGR
jgi:hypothetical protein